MKCPACGAPVTGKFCEYCGTQIEQPQNTGANATVTININMGSKLAGVVGSDVDVDTHTSNTSGSGSYSVGTYPSARQHSGAGAAAAAAAASAGSKADGDSNKSWPVTLLLCLFGGYVGLHNFYVGRWGWGLAYLLTFGLFGVGWFVDIVRIILGNFKDSQGRPIKLNY